MNDRLLLASGSTIRREMLERAGVSVDARPARIDEEAIKQSLLVEGATPRDVADKLAELKALKLSQKLPQCLVLGADQVLDLDGSILSKPANPDAARAQLTAMQGKRHMLLSAAVICEDGRPVWRHVGVVRLHMRALSEEFIDEYVARNWDSIRDAVGCYKLEEEGARLFTRIDGDYFTVLGLPLLDVLSYLVTRGTLAT